MYTAFQLAQKYVAYYLKASNGKGHGVHSPFVFEFIKFVINDKKNYPCYSSIEQLRKSLLKNEDTIQVEDFGAGSTVIKSNERIIAKMAASSLKSPKFAQLLFRIVQYYRPVNVLELGTSFGITTSYLASAHANTNVYSIEGSTAIASIAQSNFDKLHLANIALSTGDFAIQLPDILKKLNKVGLVFIDGNHRKAPTLDYFYQLLKVSTAETILIFDDIHWSAEMESAWKIIQNDERVTLTIDLFFIGIVFLRTDFKVKQHFSIRF